MKVCSEISVEDRSILKAENRNSENDSREALSFCKELLQTFKVLVRS